ncbi:MAG: hypothetical protein AB1631_33370 [Acidobacteriota bacterium]
MKTNKVKIDAKQADRLLGFVRSLPKDVVGEHLTDEEFINRSLETASPEEVERIDAHLSTCDECCAEVERLMEAAQALTEERLDRLSKKILAARGEPSLFVRFVRALESIIMPASKLNLAYAADAEEWHGQDETGLLHWSIERDEGKVIFRVSSHETGLLGNQIVVIAGKEPSQPFTLEPWGDDEVGVEIEVSDEFLSNLSAGERPRFVEIKQQSDNEATRSNVD